MVSTDATQNRDRLWGVLWGFLGITTFSLTLPATRVGVPEFGPILFGPGRVLVAAALAAVVIVVNRDPVPDRRHWSDLALVILGVLLGFPLLTSYALQSLPASHGAVVIGLAPLATAFWATVLLGERPGRLFWAGCLSGVIAVLGFAIAEGAGQPQPADALLVAAALLVGLGYTFGGKLSKEIAPWRVLCWALIFAAPPVAAILIATGAATTPKPITPPGWLAFAWVGFGSTFFGFLVWYRGLALGGVARVGQVQLLQPILALFWSWMLLNETINATTWLAALGILVAVAVCVRSR